MCAKDIYDPVCHRETTHLEDNNGGRSTLSYEICTLKDSTQILSVFLEMLKKKQYKFIYNINLYEALFHAMRASY